MIIGVDVDEVLAALHDPWDAWMKEHYHVVADWSDWHIDKTTGLGGRVFRFITPDIYLDGTVEPFIDAAHALAILRDDGHQIVYATSCINHTEDAKLDWLKGYDLWDNADEYRPGRDKNYPDLDILIDDRFANCVSFDGTAYLIDRPWNAKHPYSLRAEGILHAVEQICQPDRFYYSL